MSNKTSKLQEKLAGFPKYFSTWAREFKGGLTIFCVIGLFLFPLLTSNPYFLGLFMLAMIYSIYAASWDLLAGFTGKVSFGHAVFLAISGYVVGELTVFFNLDWKIAIIVSLLAAAFLGLVIGYITLRLKGPYLALGTLVIGIIFRQIFGLYDLKPILHGDEGIPGIPSMSSSALVSYYIILILMIVSLIIMIRVTKSNLGTIFKSIRDDERGSEASGINITKYKIIAFMISATFAGLAGALYAMYNNAVNPLLFQPLYSFYALIMAALGGLATISGGALGAFLFVFLSEFFVEFAEPLFIFSIILILIIRFASEGVLKPALERLRDFWLILLGR
ncbi:MAG: branched-chain amino acid ABC transporter permease [Promethearchaeota archaeon]|nr:MAG: branched-chain amino acid ABC transporter permease [Candidatus Lokiarchaeota archaeon]